jgi:hypothetical protein
MSEEQSVASPDADVPPAPPPGPGVLVPFLVPPTDGRRRRRVRAWLFAGLALVILVIGCVAGLGNLLYSAARVTTDRQHDAVVDYLTAVQARDYGKAYAMLCPRERERRSREAFAASYAGDPKISSFDVATPSLSDPTVHATVHYADGNTDVIRFTLWQDAKTGEFQVCGQAG